MIDVNPEKLQLTLNIACCTLTDTTLLSIFPVQLKPWIFHGKNPTGKRLQSGCSR